MRKNLLLHFLNQHAQDIVGLNVEARQKTRAPRGFLETALRAAILFSEDAAIMPPGFFLESPRVFDIIARSSIFFDAGLIKLPMREINLADLIEKKRIEYHSVSASFSGLFDETRLGLFSKTTPFFIPRQTRIGESATQHWEAGPDEDTNWIPLISAITPQGVDRLRSAPTLLLEDGIALTWPALLPQLDNEAKASEALVRVVLQQNYFSLYLDEYNAALMCDLPNNLDVFIPREMERYYSFRTLFNVLQSLGLTWVWELSPLNFVQLRCSAGWTSFADALVQLIALRLTEGNIRTAFTASAQKYRLSDQTRGVWAARTLGSTAKVAALFELYEALGAIAIDVSRHYELLVRAPFILGNHMPLSGFVPQNNPNTIQAQHTERRRRSMRRVLFATANEREATAVIELLRPAVENAQLEFDVSLDRAVPVAQGTIRTRHNSRIAIEIAVARETGGANAVLMFDRYVRSHTPDAVFFVGCAGLADEKLRTAPSSVGKSTFHDHVYIAKRAFDGDKRRIEDGRLVYDQDSFHGNGPLLERLRIMNAAGAFAPVQLITNRDFVSSSAFHASRISPDRRAIVEDFPEDAIVMEQEAFAVYQHISFLQEDQIDVPTLVLKGISDVGDPNAQDNKVETQKRATRNAAQVVLTFLMEQR